MAVEFAKRARGDDPVISDAALLAMTENIYGHLPGLRARLAAEGIIGRTPETIPDVEHADVAIPEDLFASIVGFEDIKDILLRSLRSTKPVHQLLYGPPASAKTLFATELERMSDARYALGSSASKAGLRQMLMEDRPRILILDELDKGNRRDYSVLLSVMETGRLVDTHYNRHDEALLETRVFATANTLENIPEELLSRFGGGLRIQPYTPEEFLVVAERVLVIREGAPEESAKLIALSVLQQLRSRDVRDAIRVYRLAANIEDVPMVVGVLRSRR